MTEKLTEQLSALMDNECTEHERALALRRLGKEIELLACWQRYHLISDAVKGNMPSIVTPDFSTRMSKLIAAEEPLSKSQTQAQTQVQIDRQNRPSSARPAWLKPVAGFALAASVTGVALLGLRVLDSVSIEGTQLAQQTMQPASLDISTPDISTPAASAEAALEIAVMPSAEQEQQNQKVEKLNAYLANHNELATLNGISGVMPYVRMVNYQASR